MKHLRQFHEIIVSEEVVLKKSMRSAGGWVRYASVREESEARAVSEILYPLRDMIPW